MIGMTSIRGYLLLTLVVFFCVNIFDVRAQETAGGLAIPRTEDINLRSPTGGRDYRIFIARPDGPAPEGGYPVIYALDANATFGTMAEAVRMQARVLGPAVVVGIGYAGDQPVETARRIKDLTPSPSDLTKDGADAFLAFIEEQVKPEIERRFPINRNRQTLFGHSLGGLFVLNSLFSRPESYQTYVAASPSIWWKGRSILSREVKFIDHARAHSFKLRLLITAGEFEQALSPDEAALRGATERESELRKRRMVDNAREMAGRLSVLADKGLQVSFVRFDGETHGSVIPAAISRGIRFALFPNL